MLDLENNQKAKEHIWENILSEDENLIRAIFPHLNEAEKETVITHLEKMANEDGWHPSQKRSSTYALSIIKKEIKLYEQKK